MMNMKRKIKYFSLCSSILLMFFVSSTIADVHITFPDSLIGENLITSLKGEIVNTTNQRYYINGWRASNFEYIWDKVEGVNTSTTIINRNQLETSVHNRSVFVTRPNNDIPIGYAPKKVPQGANAGLSGVSLILKTSSLDFVNDPIGEDPIIDIDNSIDSLLKLNDFYNADYRYIDRWSGKALDVSAGLHDTYKKETQIQIAIPDESVEINGTPVNLKPETTKGPLYWMTLAMGQEYFSMDKQVMMAIGAKETFIGVDGDKVEYLGSNLDQAFGCFEIEHFSLLSRAITYPKFFPKYERDLVTSLNATTFPQQTGISAQEFASFYMGEKETPSNSPYIANSFICSYLSWIYYKDILSYAKDLCLKEVVHHAIDRRIELAATIPLYNLGMNSGSQMPLHVSTYQKLLNDPDASEHFQTGNGQYRSQVFRFIEHLVDASKKAKKDPSVKIYDYAISFDEINDFFFGENGTPDNLGKGGLLHHFTCDRKEVYKRLEKTFNLLKGRAPSTQGTVDKISYRHDFLTLLRTVKHLLDVSRPYTNDEESLSWIEKNSLTQGCNQASEYDAPFILDITDKNVKTDIQVKAKVEDNMALKSFQWTIDKNWTYMNTIPFLGAGKKWNVNFTIPEKDIKKFSNGKVVNLWMFATDSSGNTTVTPHTIEVSSPILTISNSMNTNKVFFQNNMKIAIHSNNIPTEILLYSVQGKKVYRKNIQAPSSTKIDFSRIVSKGLYILSIKQKNSHKNIMVKFTK